MRERQFRISAAIGRRGSLCAPISPRARRFPNELRLGVDADRPFPHAPIEPPGAWAGAIGAAPLVRSCSWQTVTCPS